MSKAAFVDLVTADQPDAPSYFTYDAVLTSQERPTLEQTLERIGALTLDDVLALQAVGAQVLDTRDPAEFAAALESPAPSTAHARRVSRGALLAAGVVALALAAGLALAFRRQPEPVNPKVVAVAPFRISSADPGLTYLREGLVDLRRAVGRRVVRRRAAALAVDRR
jgi:hypothetical protein